MVHNIFLESVPSVAILVLLLSSMYIRGMECMACAHRNVTSLEDLGSI